MNDKKLMDLVSELRGTADDELPLNIHTSPYPSPFQKTLNTCSNHNNRTKALLHVNNQ